MKPYIYITILIVMPITGLSQKPVLTQLNKLYGLISDADNHPLSAATITITSPADSLFIWQGLTNQFGKFSADFRELDYLLKISYTGFITTTIQIAKDRLRSDYNIGTIKMTPSEKLLKEVIVNSNQNGVTIEADKKIFNIESVLSIKGGTAIDALRTIPAILITADGKISLRDGAPTILVDGKRTPLNLNQIPADQIQSIEVITTPSAKYDAQGSRGFINIIMKTDRKIGINASVRLSINSQNAFSTGLDANVRKKKINFVISYFNRRRKDISKITVDRTSTGSKKFYSESSRNGTEYFQRGKLGLDYYINNNNTFNIDGDIGGGHEDYDNHQQAFYNVSSSRLDSSSRRANPVIEKFSFWHANFNYIHKFKCPEEKLTLYAGLVEYKQPVDGTYVTDYFLKDVVQKNPLLQKYRTDIYNRMITFQSDYSMPLRDKKAKLEAGAKVVINKGDYENILSDYNKDSLYFIKNRKASYSYNYSDPTYAVYMNYNDQYGKFSYIAGARYELYHYSDLSVNRPGLVNYKNKGFFPAIFLSYSLSKVAKLQLNYSRRVRRPTYTEISPVIDYSDPQNLQQGNPLLKPEFTNLSEFSYNRSSGNTTLGATLYFRSASNYITMYASPLAADTLLISYINARVGNTGGAEFIIKNKIASWLNVTGSANALHTRIASYKGGQDLANAGYSWFGKITSDMKLFKSITIQVTANYVAPKVIPQGRMLSTSYIDVSIGRYFLKDKAMSIDVTLSDLLNTDRQKTSISSSEIFKQSMLTKLQTRVLRLSCSYRFKK